MKEILNDIGHCHFVGLKHNNDDMQCKHNHYGCGKYTY